MIIADWRRPFFKMPGFFYIWTWYFCNDSVCCVMSLKVMKLQRIIWLYNSFFCFYGADSKFQLIAQLYDPQLYCFGSFSPLPDISVGRDIKQSESWPYILQVEQRLRHEWPCCSRTAWCVNKRLLADHLFLLPPSGKTCCYSFKLVALNV